MKAWSKREVLTYLDRVIPVLGKVDYFELLDVPHDADESAIQAAFHNMAAGLHPDRHRNSLDHARHEQLIVVYAKIAEAYRVLRSPKHRENYLRKAAREQKQSSTGNAAASTQDTASALALLSPKAQQLYRRAMASARTGDIASATLNLRMALAKHPQSGFLKSALRALNSARKP